MGLLMGKRQLLTELSALYTSVFSFQDNNKVFTKLDMCIDIVEIWLGIAIGYILSFLQELSPHDMIMVVIISHFYFIRETIFMTTL